MSNSGPPFVHLGYGSRNGVATYFLNGQPTDAKSWDELLQLAAAFQQAPNLRRPSIAERLTQRYRQQREVKHL